MLIVTIQNTADHPLSPEYGHYRYEVAVNRDVIARGEVTNHLRPMSPYTTEATIRACFDAVYRPALPDAIFLYYRGPVAWRPVPQAWWQRLGRRITRRRPPMTCDQLEAARHAVSWERFAAHLPPPHRWPATKLATIAMIETAVAAFIDAMRLELGWRPSRPPTKEQAPTP